MEQVKDTHDLQIENCKKVMATAISSVDAFSSRQVVLSYQGGRIVIEGEGLKVVNFSQTSGAFTAVGTVRAVRYTQSSAKFIQKLLK